MLLSIPRSSDARKYPVFTVLHFAGTDYRAALVSCLSNAKPRTVAPHSHRDSCCSASSGAAIPIARRHSRRCTSVCETKNMS